MEYKECALCYWSAACEERALAFQDECNFFISFEDDEEEIARIIASGKEEYRKNWWSYIEEFN